MAKKKEEVIVEEVKAEVIEKVKYRNMYPGNYWFKAENRNIKPGEYFEAYEADLTWGIEKGYIKEITF
jgi:hypothetical protein